MMGFTQKDKKKQFDFCLNEFMKICDDLIRCGMPYVSVILNHELFRYLYPMEPYSNFTNDDPVEFILDHIKKLIDLGLQSKKSILPYEVNLSPVSSHQYNKTLEKRTSDLYSLLWQRFDEETIAHESVNLLLKRLDQETIDHYIKGKDVLDMGCGSGRYAFGLSVLGAKRVIGVDIDSKSFRRVREVGNEKKPSVSFMEGNFLELPFCSSSFDFVFCNGTLHHSRSIREGLNEIRRVMKNSGRAFIYLYGKGGIFWDTRIAMRRLFKKIPIDYTQRVLNCMGVPSNRFIFCDVWYVPVETLTERVTLEKMLLDAGFSFYKIISENPLDLDAAIARGVKDAEIMWGDGEHRYIVWRQE